MSRSQLTAPLSHLRFLIPPLFHLLLILLFLRPLLFLLPSAAEAVQAAEAGAGERHRLPVAPHPPGSARGGGSKRRENEILRSWGSLFSCSNDLKSFSDQLLRVSFHVIHSELPKKAGILFDVEAAAFSS